MVKSFVDVEIDYFIEAIEYFSSLSTVQPNIGILCVCSGASIGLFLSTICSKVSAVISFNGCYAPLLSTEYQGKKVMGLSEYYKNSDIPMKVLYDQWGGFILTDILNHTPIEDLAIMIEKTNAKLLIIAGEDDKSVNSLTSGMYMVDRMKKHGKGSQVTFLSYPGAGHFIDPPFMPQTLAQYFPSFKIVAAIGGNVVHNASASDHCWKQVLNFLNLHVGL